MKKHTKIYMDAMGYDTSSFIDCECCGKHATDIHHIEARGMGGSKTKDRIDNLMALCRTCHNQYGDITDLKPKLKEIHALRMKERGLHI